MRLRQFYTDFFIYERVCEGCHIWPIVGVIQIIAIWRGSIVACQAGRGFSFGTYPQAQGCLRMIELQFMHVINYTQVDLLPAFVLTGNAMFLQPTYPESVLFTKRLLHWKMASKSCHNFLGTGLETAEYFLYQGLQV